MGFCGYDLSRLAPVVCLKALEDFLMVEKPTCEALEQRVKALEKQVKRWGQTID
jgi:hypothetical protein